MEQTETPRLDALADWRRIEWIIRMTGRTVNSFTEHIGLPEAEVLYRIQRGRNRISRDLAERIHNHYPMVNKQWILWGRGPKQNEGFRLGPPAETPATESSSNPNSILGEAVY